MTVGGWILFFALGACIVGCGALIGGIADHVGIGAVVSIPFVIVLLAGMLFYYNGTAAGGRAFKSQQSNFNKGIERTVKVYDVNGKLIQEYDGKFDIEYDDDRIVFDDENNKRHIIYYPTGTIIIDEV